MFDIESFSDVLTISNTLEHFAELEQVLQMIDKVKASTDNGFEKDYEKFTEVLTRYQEQPHLLDPHLPVLLSNLLGKVRDVSYSQGVVHAAFKYLYVICKVRTYKALVKFMPHELSDLEFALDLLEHQNSNEHKNWETRYMLLLWMSILVLNPFHLARLDAYEVNSNSDTSNNLQHKTKIERIYDLIVKYSSACDTCSDMAAYLASKYLVRTDIKDVYMTRYFDMVMAQHNIETVDIKFGQLAAVAAILKHGKREDLLSYADKLHEWIVSCQYKTESVNFLKYKLYIKIVQRIGLVHLKPRIATWRYKRGTRSLATNLSSTRGTMIHEPNLIGEGEDNEEIIVPDTIEEVVEELLQALRADGSDIRWSAAKGIARIANRLPKELADEVIGNVIDILMPYELHAAWHGACVALAELARRGLLLPYRLHGLVPLLLQALFYDEMKGYMSVGQHIRDAACYMCWAFARSYKPDDLKPFVQQISSALLTVVVFDREINCRRAASAAFQESVGRLGNFPHGIEIMRATDFFAVGVRQNTFLNISNFIAQFDEYRTPLIAHLVERKVGHWDRMIRELTAKALHKLALHEPKYMSEVVLPKLFSNTDSIDVNLRHGSVLAIGELILALRHMEQNAEVPNSVLINNQLIDELSKLMRKFLERQLYRGVSGELMKLCCTNFIKNCSLAKLDVAATYLVDWQTIIDISLTHRSVNVREDATEAFFQLCTAYYNKPECNEITNAIILRYLAGADEVIEEHIRMGYLAVLGALPRFLTDTHFDIVRKALLRHSLMPVKEHDGMNESHEYQISYTWSEARKESVKSLVKFVKTVGFDNRNGVTFGEPALYSEVIECLLLALDEYTLDDRGDVGAWVREAAMIALFELVTTSPRYLLNATHAHKIIVGFMQQAVEKIDRVRGLAGRFCCKLVHTQPPVLNIKEHDLLRSIFPENDETVLWLFADHTFPIFCKLLQLPEYSKRVLLGLTASIGQLGESLIKYSSGALFQFLRAHPDTISRLCNEIVENFEENLLNERVTYPMLSFLNIIIASGTINDVLLDPKSDFAENVLRLVNEEIMGYKKLYKIIASISVYCQLVQVPWLSARILAKMTIFLGLTHVHVRKTTATKLYEALALHGDATDIPEENMEDVLTQLSETDWGLPVLEVRVFRNQLCALMGIKPPVPNSKAVPTKTSV